MNVNIAPFKTLDTDPGGTLKRFSEYMEEMELLFQLVFRKADGSAFTPDDKEKKALVLLKGGRDMKNLFTHVGKVSDTDTYQQTVDKIKKGLSDRTNKIVQRNMLLSNFPQGSKSFERWSQEISEAAMLISYDNYDWKQATVDAILLQTSSAKLRERALQENISYDALLMMGITKEQSEKGAALLEQASGQSRQIKIEEEVRRLQVENKRLKKVKSKYPCNRCGLDTCQQNSKCPANGQKCAKCKRMNHFARVCKSGKSQTNRSSNSFGQVSDSDDSEEEVSGHILVRQLDSKSILANIFISGSGEIENCLEMATDTGVSKTIVNYSDWKIISNGSQIVKTSKKFRPYGTPIFLNIIGKCKVQMRAENGARIDTWMFIHKSNSEKSLLGKEDAIKLGIVTLNLKGATEATCDTIDIQNVQCAPEDPVNGTDEDRDDLVAKMKQLTLKYSAVFTEKTGKYIGPPIKVQVNEHISPVVQPLRRIPLNYVERTKAAIDSMVKEDILEGPITAEEAGSFISNFVITSKNDNDDIRVTLDCQAVNKAIYQTHEPMPTFDELRHKLHGSTRFSSLDMTNCYHQFEIEENARKLYTGRTPWGLYRYKRMVMGTSLASSEIQKRIREMIKDCKGVIHIKDDIVVHGVGSEHDENLEEVLKVLHKHGITLRPRKCKLGKSEIKWFGNIFSKDGMSPDPEKCRIIKEWPSPKSSSEVKSFLQTLQFNAKFMGGKPGEKNYPDLTAPLKELSKKNAHFIWGQRQESAFNELKHQLCSDNVMAPYNTN